MKRREVSISYLILLLLASFSYAGKPEQIHIGLTNDPTQVAVSWVTLDSDKMKQYVEYGLNPATLTNKEDCSNFTFQAKGDEHRNLTIHTAVMVQLKLTTRYCYHVGSVVDGFSDTFCFTTLSATGTIKPLTFAVYGDLGHDNDEIIPLIKEEVQKNHFDVILHVGDFAYDFEDDNARVGDSFMNDIQSIAAQVPYMTCPGNHEAEDNGNNYDFANYENRFSIMPYIQSNSSNVLWHSFDVGQTHFVAIDTEAYFFQNFNIQYHYEWLENDLKKANKNRAITPWIIVFGHRPLYCTTSPGDIDDCGKKATLLRDGYMFPDGYLRFGLEELLYKYGVDLFLCGHEHSYERIWPVYRQQVIQYNLLNAKAPIHIVTGAAGNKEDFDLFMGPYYPWSAVRNSDYSISKMTVFNHTHIYYEQINIDRKIVDNFWVIKYSHGPYPKPQWLK